MFGIGTTELVIIFLVTLIVLGPKKIPELARGIGRGMAELRRALESAEREDARAAYHGEPSQADSPSPAEPYDTFNEDEKEAPAERGDFEQGDGTDSRKGNGP